jgi:hypothetical protein
MGYSELEYSGSLNQRDKTEHKVGKGLFAASQEQSILLGLLQV